MSRNRPMPSPLPDAPHYEPATSWRMIAGLVALMIVVIVAAGFWLVSL